MISGSRYTPAPSPKTLIRVTGQDAFTFLQGQFSNDLRPPPGSATHGLWLNQKGRVIADSHVLRISENEFLLTSAHSAADVIRQRLEDYIIADEVELADESGITHALVFSGAGSGGILGQLLGAAPAGGRFVRSGELLAFAGCLLPGENFEILGTETAVTKIRRELMAHGATEMGAAEADFARIAAGIPAVPLDLGPEDLPNEGGLEATAVSYTKGCYLGQEVMARLKNLGQVRRRLHGLTGRGTPPVSRAALYQGGKKVGEIRSAASRGDAVVALAMLSLLNLNPTEGLGRAPDGPAEFSLLPHG